MSEAWMSTYPTVAAVQAAHADTLAAWFEHLPLPQTDVERTVHRRIRARLDAHIKEAAPDLHAGIEKLRQTMAKAGIHMPGNFFTREPR